MVEETYPSGRVVRNEFEADGDISRIYGRANPTATEHTYASSFSYTPDGKIEKLRLGNGLWEAAKFNTRLQTTEIALGHGVTSGDLWKLGYEYGELKADGTVDAAKNTGNIARQSVSFSGLASPFIQSYKYDSLSRLTEAKETSNNSQTWIQQFGYDRYGNRTSLGQNVNGLTLNTTPAIDVNTNRFTGTDFHYDKNGNLTQDIGPNNQSRTIVFNGDNKQSVVKDANGDPIGTYYFDGEGKRVKKVTDLETTVYVYSSGKLVAEYSTAAPPAAPTTSYTATDMLGSPRVLTNSMGEVVSRRDFMPFGEELFADGQNRTAAGKYSQTGQDSVRKRFTGYEKDPETGLDFAEARMYNNQHGRFTAVDPLLTSGKSANPQTFNRFVYVLNNPLVLTDPDGLQTGTASGFVYQRGDHFRVYAQSKSAPRGFKRVTSTINGTTSIGGVLHTMTVTPRSITVGDRVDNVKFASPTAPVSQGSSVENAAIRALATTASYGVYNESVGIVKGVVNSPVFAWNGLTHEVLNGPVTGLYFQGSNPLAVRNILRYSNPLQTSAGSAGSTGFLAGLGFAGGAVLGGSSMPSVVPETTSWELNVFRVYGGDARAQGFSWTPTNPTTVTNFRNAAGLPSGGESGAMNTADFMIQGRVNPSNIIKSKFADPLDGNIGGLPELIIDPNNVTITNFQVLKP